MFDPRPATPPADLGPAADQAWQDVRAEGNVALLHAIRVLRDRTGAGIRECADALRASQARAQEGAIQTEADRLRAQVRGEVAEEIARAIEAAALEVIDEAGGRLAGDAVAIHLTAAARIAREHAAKEG